jgi:hypothetical protein
MGEDSRKSSPDVRRANVARALLPASVDAGTPAGASKAVNALLPSVTEVIFVALLGVLVLTPLSVRLLGDAGIGWHIRTGQLIAATHAVPRLDPFSSTAAGKPWFAWEWLYDLLVGALESRMGLNGVVWFTAIVIAAVFAWLFRFLIARGVSVPFAVVLTLLAVTASMIHFLARPHVLSWLFTLAWFVILESSERACFPGNRPAGRLWSLPVLMLVWVNVHGGFLLGFVLLGIFFAGAAWTWFTTRQDRLEDSLVRIAAEKRAWALLWVGLASAAASLVNPYGWKLHAHIYSYLSNRFLMDHIDEFRSADFHGIAPRCFLLLVILTLALMAVRGRELRLSGVLVVLFAVYSGIYSARNIPVSAILLVAVVGPLLGSTVKNRLSGSGTLPGFWLRMTAIEEGKRWPAWSAAAVVITLLIAINGARVGSKMAMDAHFDSNRMPVAAVDYLATYNLAGPVLAPDSWGGYLIYRLYPRARVVLDDRHDLYGEEFFKAYLKLVHVEPGWEDFLREHPSGCVLVPRESALASRLASREEWKAIYVDDVAIAFVPTGSERLNLPSVTREFPARLNSIAVLSDSVDHRR